MPPERLFLPDQNTPNLSKTEPQSPRGTGITRRAFLIGLFLIPLMCFWNEYTEIVAQATDLAAMSLIIAVVFALFVILLINFALKRFAPKYALTQAEIMYIYIMQTVSIGISGIGMMQFLNTFLADVFYYGTPENHWKEKLLPAVRPWLLPKESVVKAYFTGQSSFWRMDHILGWLSPIGVWSVYIVVLLGVMLCIASLVRRQWADQERLSFPITQLPLEISKEGWATDLFSNRLLWIGFLIPVVLESLASLNYLYPNVPFLPLKPSEPRLDLTPLFSNPPWNGVGTLQLSFYPLVIGLTYFLPLDVAFSLWFFYLFGKFENVVVTALGYHQPGAGMTAANMPYLGEQSAGAFIMVALFALFGARHYIKAAAKSLISRPERRQLRDENEPLPYMLALFGAVGGLLFLMLFGMAIGMSWWVPAIFFGLYYLYVITFTRMRAEAGLPWGFGPYMNVHDLMRAAGGTQAFTSANIVGLNVLLWQDLDMRTTQMPNHLEAMKIGESTRMNLRHVAAVIFVAIVVGTLASWAAVLTCYYQYGAATAKVNDWRTYMGKVPWTTLKDWLDNPVRPNLARMEGVGVGMLVTAFLLFMRTRFVWWPFHPIGYAVSGTFTMAWLWCATLVGWLLKALIIRYGGMSSYRRYLPFFIGLVLGDYITSSVWAIYGSVTGVHTYRCFPI